MLSRAAEKPVSGWGRYMERAEATARMISMGQRMAVLPGTTAQSEWDVGHAGHCRKRCRRTDR